MGSNRSTKLKILQNPNIKDILWSTNIKENNPIKPSLRQENYLYWTEP